MNLDIAKNLWYLSLETETNELDSKHANIVSDVKNKTFDSFCKEFRNWSKQNDCGIPFQLNFYNLKSYGFLKYTKYIASKLKNHMLYFYDSDSYFFDDLNLIKLLNGYDILKNNPVHKTPGNNLAYFINKNTSANIRWLRYIYFATVIRNTFQNISEFKFMLDIGSYYGGLQYVLKDIVPNCTQIMVDFPHQLARSAIFLGKSFPQSKIYSIHDDQTLTNYFSNNLNMQLDFILLTTDYYHKFSKIFINNNQRVDLLTNFYSLGEMSRIHFKSYINSELLKTSKSIYFCNRYDSSPFFEKTYQESYSLLDYLLEGYQIILNRNSGIHNYMTPIRNLNGVTKPRPISSGYFELIQRLN
tara:strand:+ start:3401 stop:4471 length:1071 start_codon:yes stop_codon:yes gene_type:complete